MEFYLLKDENKVDTKIYFDFETKDKLTDENKVVLCSFLKLKRPNELGFVEDDELDEIINYKDKLLTKLTSLTFLGFKTKDSWIEIYFYALDKKGFESNASLCAKEFDYQCSISSFKDKKHKFYFNSIYPSIYSFSHINNKKILSELVEAGDDLNKNRDVEFYFRFSTSSALQRVKVALQNDAYADFEEFVDEDDDLRFILKAKKNITLMIDELDQQSDDLINLAISEHGEYEGFNTGVSK